MKFLQESVCIPLAFFLLLLATNSVVATEKVDRFRQRPGERFQRFRQLRNQEKSRPGSAETDDSSRFERIQKFRNLHQKMQTQTSGSVPEHADISYGNHERQKMDIYTPDNPKHLPVMIYVHGGAWSFGNKRMVETKPDYFISKNWIFVSINYRLLPDGRHPENVKDIASALAWIYQNIAQYGGCPEKIFLSGFSAGAHLAALVALDESYLAATGHNPSIIKSVVLLDNPVSDVTTEVLGESRDRLLRAFGSDENTHKNASPVYHVAKSSNSPAFIMAYSGGMPSNSPMSAKDFKLQAVSLGQALNHSGIKNYISCFEQLNHSQLNRGFGCLKDEHGVTDWIMKHLKQLTAK